MANEQRLAAGQDLALPVQAGDELFCARGDVVLHPAGLLQDLPAARLGAGRGWRAPASGQVLARASSASLLRIVRAAAPPAPPPGVGRRPGWLRRLAPG